MTRNSSSTSSSSSSWHAQVDPTQLPPLPLPLPPVSLTTSTSDGIEPHPHVNLKVTVSRTDLVTGIPTPTVSTVPTVSSVPTVPIAPNGPGKNKKRRQDTIPITYARPGATRAIPISLATAPPPVRSLVHLLYTHAFPPPTTQLSSAVTATNLAHLFSAIDASQDATHLHRVPAQLPTVTLLYPFQRRTVGWCLARELGVSQIVPRSSNEERALRFVCLRKPNADLGIPGLFMDAVNDTLVEALDDAGPELEPGRSIVPLYNGFLAEEMGLGKSLIMLAVALANPFSESVATSRMQLAAPLTESAETPTPKLVKATLIVTPPALVSQWQTEIATHTPSLTVLVYQGGGSRSPQDPHIGEYDIVLTTFYLLSSEFNVAQPDHGRSRRFDRKYDRPVSHLAQCVFWRVVMDEAQMVPGETSKVTKLLCRIPRVHSWCMTGTPFSRSISGDLAHMSRFLHHPPLPYDRLLTHHPGLFSWYIRQVLHRTSKASIKHELDLPAQHDVVIRLHLHSVEADAYNHVAREWTARIAAGVRVLDRGEPEREVGETLRAFEARHRAWVQACGDLTQALSTLRLAANHPALARRVAEHSGHHAAGPQRLGADAPDAPTPGLVGAQAFAIVNVLRDAFLRNVAEYYRLHREVGAVKVKQAVAHDRLEEYDTALELLTSHLADLHAVSAMLAADKTLVHASAAAAAHHDAARMSSLESEVQLQVHQVLFLLAGLHHVKGNQAQEDALYAQAEAIRRNLLKEHIGHVEKLQTMVKRDVERETQVDVQTVQQVKTQVHAAVAVVAVKAGGGRVESPTTHVGTDTLEHPRPWAKPKPPADPDTAADNKGKRKRKRPSESELDDDGGPLGDDGMHVDPALAGLYVVGRTLDDAANVLEALETQAALVDEWRPVLEEKLLMPLYRDQPGADEQETRPSSATTATARDTTGQDQDDQEGPSEYELGLQSQHMAEAYLAQLSALIHDIRHILNRTAPLSAIDAQAAKKRRAPRNRTLTHALGEAVIDMLDMGQLHEVQLAQDLADSDDGLVHPELERPLRTARLAAVVPVAATSLYAVQHLLARVALDEHMPLERTERDRCKTLSARLGGLVDHMLKQVAIVEVALAHYRRLFNARVVYFQELQEISDSVAVPDELQAADAERIRGDFLARYERDVQKVQGKLPAVSARRRYLRLLVESYGERDEGAVPVDCIVCAERFENGFMTPCGHLACRVCMKRWLETHPTCPECRMHVRPSDLATVIMHVPARPQEAPSLEREEPTDADDAPAPTPPSPDGGETTSATTPQFPPPPVTTTVESGSTTTTALLPGWQYTSIQGQYGAKVTAVTQLVCTMMAREPAAKALVFSQFEAILEVIKHSLGLNQVHAKHFSPTTVHAFQTDPATKVLLLNAKSQAAGLTLNAARYILMVEPIANAAIDRQAITRVHRIGQHHTTYVVRFVVAGTVEERVHELLQTKYRDMEAAQDHDGDELPPAQEHAGMSPARQANGNQGAALGVAKVTSKAFNGRNEIVDPVDMLFCLAERPAEEQTEAGSEEDDASRMQVD